MNWGRDITRKEICEAARTWVNVPYRHLGRSRRYVDCIGLIWAIPVEMKLDVPAIPAVYSKFPKEDMLIRECQEKLVLAPQQGIRHVRPGDIMVLWGWERDTAQHFAVIDEINGMKQMIHAFQKAGQVVEHGLDEFWSKRYVATYNYPGTTD